VLGDTAYLKDRFNHIMNECQSLSLEPAQQLRLVHTIAELGMTRLIRMTEGLKCLKKNFADKQKEFSEKQVF